MPLLRFRHALCAVAPLSDPILPFLLQEPVAAEAVPSAVPFISPAPDSVDTWDLFAFIGAEATTLVCGDLHITHCVSLVTGAAG